MDRNGARVCGHIHWFRDAFTQMKTGPHGVKRATYVLVAVIFFSAVLFPRTSTSQVVLAISTASQGHSLSGIWNNEMWNTYTSKPSLTGNAPSGELEISQIRSSMNMTGVMQNLTANPFLPLMMNRSVPVFLGSSALFSLNTSGLTSMGGALSSARLDFYVNRVSMPGPVRLALFASNLTAIAGDTYARNQGGLWVGVGPPITINSRGHYSLQAYALRGTLPTLSSFQNMLLAIEPDGLWALTSSELKTVPTLQSQNISLTISSLGSSDPPKAAVMLVENIYPAGLENYWPWLSYACVAVVSLFFKNDKLTETLFLTVLSTSAAWEVWILGTYLFGPFLADVVSVVVAATLILANLEQQYEVFRMSNRRARSILRR